VLPVLFTAVLVLAFALGLLAGMKF